jgi:hypothetical protein
MDLVWRKRAVSRADHSQDSKPVADAPCDPERSPRIHLVWTRSIDGVPGAGRIKVAQGVRAALSASGFSVSESTIRPLTSEPTARRLGAALGEFLRSMVRGRPLPLQCLLFSDRRELRRVLAELPADCDAIYLDGVRCITVLDAIARGRPDLAILTDLDDLMSRRMSLLLELGQPPSTGYLKSSMPGVVEWLLASHWFSQAVLRYEAASLRQVEKRVARLSDAVVLISGEDAAVLRQRSPGADVRAIPIAARVERDSPRLAQGPLRFVFIGTDALRQNQLTIDALVDLWRREDIPTPLVVYGQQQRTLEKIPNVLFAGYAESIEQVYDERSILLSPSFVAGGVKTKVLEAFAYGAPVLGNPVTFEAIGIGPDYPLLIDDESEMLPLLKEPEAFRERFERAAAIGLHLVRQHHNPTQIETAWVETVCAAIARRQRRVYKEEGWQTG